MKESRLAEDRVLVDRILAGDEKAFESLVDASHRLMDRLARAVINNPAVVEEILQDSWAAILEALPRFEGRSALKTWMCRILLNCAKKKATRERRTQPFSSLGEDDAAMDPAVDPSRFSAQGFWTVPPARSWDALSPEGLLLRREVREAINRAIDKLPSSQRSVLTLRDLEGWESEEVCNVLEISETNQRVLLHRARAKVRAALEPYVGDER
jgi:RNA polymerase sigma-70 factor (ECF subfamily)